MKGSYLVANNLNCAFLERSGPLRRHESLDACELAGIHQDILVGEWNGEETGYDCINAFEVLSDLGRSRFLDVDCMNRRSLSLELLNDRLGK